MFGRYFRWLHGRWPAGIVEKLPEVHHDGTTAIAGVRIVGDLTGIPLLKFAADTGARAAQAIAAELEPGRDPSITDVAIVGGGVAGIAAAIEAKARGLSFVVLEASAPISTIVNFPKKKPIYVYPTDLKPAGSLQLTADVKEALVEELERQRRDAGIEPVIARIDRLERRDGLIHLHHDDGKVTRARRAIVAIGRSGDFRRLGVPGEEKDKVTNRLHDPAAFAGKKALVVGGGDAAAETAIALALAGAEVTLSHRAEELARPKPENVEQLRELERAGRVKLEAASRVTRIDDATVELDGSRTIANDVVFTMIGRHPPLDFFRDSGIRIRGEWHATTIATFAAFVAFCVFVYLWKSGGDLTHWFESRGLFPFNVPVTIRSLALPENLRETLAVSLGEPGFYYSLAYTLCVTLFGIARIRRRRTPYVTAQTLALIAFQVLPLFLLPYILLPWAGRAGWFDSGFLKTAADNLFPPANYGHGREYWRAFGFVLAWPLFLYNVFTDQPNAWWLAISFVQTFVIIPLIVRRWGKGAYCGWVCSCGALAETLGDTHRQKMPHGPIWNRLNMVGQVILAIAFVLLGARIVAWAAPTSSIGQAAARFHVGLFVGWRVLGVELNYKHVVDLFLAGIVGVGCYFWLSGRVWCRFACPLAALMHVYARFSSFRIFADKKKCISCNVCTSVCHQGIDIMSFANKGLPMEDPECVRCSACVQSCPTGVLTFGRLGRTGHAIPDRLAASPVQMREKKRLPLV